MRLIRFPSSREIRAMGRKDALRWMAIVRAATHRAMGPHPSTSRVLRDLADRLTLLEGVASCG